MNIQYVFQNIMSDQLLQLVKCNQKYDNIQFKSNNTATKHFSYYQYHRP